MLRTRPQGRPLRKSKNLIKNQTGRPYSAPRGGPRGVLLPFLTEDLPFPQPPHAGERQPRCSMILNWATFSEYQRRPRDARPIAKKDRLPRNRNGPAWPPFARFRTSGCMWRTGTHASRGPRFSRATCICGYCHPPPKNLLDSVNLAKKVLHSPICGARLIILVVVLEVLELWN